MNYMQMIGADKNQNRNKIIGIPIFGKGGTNHLHRQEIVDEFSKHNWNVVFWVRSDYIKLLEPLSNCAYREYPGIPKEFGLRESILEFLKHLRFQYPSSDPWRQWQYRTLNQMTPNLFGRLVRRLIYFIANYRISMQAAVVVERFLLKKKIKKSFLMNEKIFDRLLVLGIGTEFDDMGPSVTRWAQMAGIPVVHFVGNYDSISSKGFRAHPVEKLLVWAQQMREDAIEVQGLSDRQIVEIGPLRYNLIPPRCNRSKSDFIKMSNLDENAKTIMFAGSAYDFHYFEMLEAFDRLKNEIDDPLQLIIRVYPNKYLLTTPYFKTFLKYAKTRKDIWVSIADPNYHVNHNDIDVLKIEETELWYILQFSDVVINIFSTLTIEACLFNKPVINMWYFPKCARALKQPIYYPYPLTRHIRRVMDSGAAELAENREEFIRLINKSLENPSEKETQRKHLVKKECGEIDGKAVSRLIQNCI